ncbi:MAG: hypothetical protein AAF614_02320 [Chloroflexota bacterium]
MRRQHHGLFERGQRVLFTLEMVLGGQVGQNWSLEKTAVCRLKMVAQMMVCWIRSFFGGVSCGVETAVCCMTVCGENGRFCLY